MLGFLTNQTTETVLWTYICFQIYSAIVQSLPTPQELAGDGNKVNPWYKAFYNFLSILGADFKSYVSKLGSTTISSSELQPSGELTTSKATITTTKGDS